MLLAWKVAPALACGNTIILKPSEFTPLTALLFAKIAREAGVPPGVINIVNGTGPKVGQPLAEHPKIEKVRLVLNGMNTYADEYSRLLSPAALSPVAR